MANTNPLYTLLTQVTHQPTQQLLRQIVDKLALVEKAAGINPTHQPLTRPLDSGGQAIQMVADPVHPQDAVNKRTLLTTMRALLAKPVVKGSVGSGKPGTGSGSQPTSTGFPTTPEPNPGPPFDFSAGDIPPGPPLPTSPPARTQACGVTLQFQGMSMVTSQYGTIPWFEVAISSLSPADRQAVYAQKQAAGDTHCIIDISWNYNEAPSYSYPVPGTDLTKNLPAFRALVQEVISNNFIAMIFLAGDGESKAPNANGTYPYNDPAGWTYGHQWLMANLETIITLLQGNPNQGIPDLTPYCLFIPGFDGVMPGWEPVELDNYLLAIRALLGPQGYSGLLLAAGYSHWGLGAGNYTDAAGQGLDVILNQFPVKLSDNYNQVWQIAARMLGPSYNRPTFEDDPQFDSIDPNTGLPVKDDPNPPWYLRGGTPRGPYFPIAFEYDTWRWVRNFVSLGEVQGDRAYLQQLGYVYVS